MKSMKLFEKLIFNKNNTEIEQEIFMEILNQKEYTDRESLKIFLIYLYKTFINILCRDEEYIVLFMYEKRYSFYKYVEYWKIYLAFYKSYLMNKELEIININILYGDGIVDEKILAAINGERIEGERINDFYEKIKRAISFLNNYDFPAKIFIFNYFRSLIEFKIFSTNQQNTIENLISKNCEIKNSFLVYGSPDFHQTEKIEIAKGRGANCIENFSVRESAELKFKNLKIKTHRLLGRGGSAQVYLISINMESDFSAIDHEFREKIEQREFFAYKIVHIDVEDEHFADVMNEIKILQQLRNNDYVVQMYDYVIETRSIGIIMEAGEEDLENYLRRKKKEFHKNDMMSTVKLHSECPVVCDYFFPYTRDCIDFSNFGFLSIEEIDILFSRLIEIFRVLSDHQFVHRDIKHKNFIFIEGKLKIIDFGLSRSIAEEKSKHLTKKNAGTVAFMAPESFSNEVSKKTDIWALGMLFHEIIFGRLIFKNYHQSELMNLRNTKLEISVGCVQSTCKCKKLVERSVKYYCAEHKNLPPISQYSKYIAMIKEAIKLDPKERATINRLMEMFYS